MRTLGVLFLLAGCSGAGAQTVERRVAAAPDGEVRLTFASRPGTCGDGENVISSRGALFGEVVTRDIHTRRSRCEEGPVRVRISKREGRLERVRVHVAGSWRPPRDPAAPVTDLGVLPARQAADYLVALVPRLSSRDAGRAVLAAAFADSAVIWPALLGYAKGNELPRGARHEVMFWLARDAADSAVGVSSEDDGMPADDEEGELRDQAIFALTQMPRREGIPALIEVARTHKEPRARRKAIFWLGQSEDRRAVELFEAMLRKGR